MNKTEAFKWTQRLLTEIYKGDEEEAKRFHKWIGEELNDEDEAKQ